MDPDRSRRTGVRLVKRIAMVIALVVAATVPVVPGTGTTRTAGAAASPCTGTQIGTRPINGDGERIGELVVHKSTTSANQWCALAYHRNGTVGVALPTELRVTSPAGVRTLDSGTFEQYAGPGRVTTSACASGAEPCWSVSGSITYRGTTYDSLPFFLVDSATDANPCGGTRVASAPITVGGTVVAEVVSYRISPGMYCGLTLHRGPTVGVASYTELGVWTPDGKGLVDSGTFRYHAGPAQVWDVLGGCDAGTAGSCYRWLGGITVQGRLLTAAVPFQP